MIKIKNVYHSYGNLEVLKGVDLEINKGDITSIVGESGVGKTTLLQLLGGLDTIQKGEIEINERVINNFSKEELTTFRNQEIGFIFQFHNLLAEFTAIENICLPAFISGVKEADAKRKAFELLEILGIKERAHHKPNELSGGEKQRIAVARSLINSPSIILADEPTGNLDTKNSDALYKLFIELNKNLNQTFVIITHNNKLAELANYKFQLQDGKIM